MITRLGIRNFKSVKELDLDCRRVNVLIGEPNTGKSNILESLGLLSSTKYGNHRAIMRFENTSNLFWDDFIEEPIDLLVQLDREYLGYHDLHFRLAFATNGFTGTLEGHDKRSLLWADYQGISRWGPSEFFAFIKFYRFKPLAEFPDLNAELLLPPDGPNLFSLIKAREAMRKTATGLIGRFGLKLNLRMQEHKLEVAKHKGELIYSYPYVTVSDTIKRMLFYLAAIETNKDSTLVLEEPESKSFPFYTKELAERIGHDKSNQYFVSTHNPYFLESVLQKTPKDDLAVFVVHMVDYQTRARRLEGNEVAGLLDEDAFFNLKQYTDSSE